MKKLSAVILASVLSITIITTGCTKKETKPVEIKANNTTTNSQVKNKDEKYNGWISNIPSIAGMPLESAKTELEKDYFKLGTITYKYSSTVPSGVVIDQDEGINVTEKWTKVNIVVSKGSEPIKHLQVHKREQQEKDNTQNKDYVNRNHFDYKNESSANNRSAN